MRGQVEGQLTLFQEGFLVSPSPQPGSGGARKMTAISGRKWSGLSKNSGRLGLLEKMLLESLRWHSPIFYLNWKPVDIGQGRFLYQFALSEPDTGVTGWRSSDAGKGPAMWKTPVASDAAARKMYVNSRGEPNLSGQVKLWPTPTAQDHKRRGPNSRQQGLPEQVIKMYNTPTAQDAKNSTLPQSQLKRGSLVGDVMREMYPTPTTGDGLCGGTGNYQQLKKPKEAGTISEEERGNMSRGNGGHLNPEWVEWLMGFPAGWTDIGI